MAATPRAKPTRTARHDARAAVIGAGLMGHGIAQVLAAAGVSVTVHDANAEVADATSERVAENLRSLGRDDTPAARIHSAGSLAEAVADVDWVFEAVPEKLALKQEIFRELDAAAPPSAVLATNTSVMSITEIAAEASERRRILGTHWWNPPFLVPLVEVVQTTETDPDTVLRTMHFLAEIGKTPVHVRRDVPGFVGNRLQHALWREAFNLVEDGVCDADTVDMVVKAGFGLRLPVLGPMENADLIGLDLTLDIHEYILPRLNPPSEPSPGLRRLVDEGHLGMKSGRGARTWSPEAGAEVRRTLREHLARAAERGPLR